MTYVNFRETPTADITTAINEAHYVVSQSQDINSELQEKREAILQSLADIDTAISDNKKGMRDAEDIVSYGEIELKIRAVNEIIAAANGLSKDDYIARIRKAIRTTSEATVQFVVRFIHDRAINGGLELPLSAINDDLSKVLTVKQTQRLIDVIPAICIRHPETGNYLPSYQVFQG